MVTGPGARAGERYRVGGNVASIGVARRYEAVDEKLARDVALWVVDEPEGGPRREQMLSLARVIARTPDPALLRVLDVVPDAGSLAVVLEAPPGRATGALTGDEAARLVLDAAGALERASAAGLTPERLDARLVHRATGPEPGAATRLDPIGVFLPPDDGRAPDAPAVLLAGLIDAIATEDAPVARRLRTLAAQWSGDARHRIGLHEAVEELRAVAGVAADPPSLHAPPLANGTSNGAGIDEEDTLEMEPWPAPAALPPPPPAAPASRDFAPASAPPPPARRRVEEEPVAPAPARWRELRLNVLVPVIAAVFVVALGTWGLFFADESPTEQAARAPSGNQGEFGPPLEAPRGNRVTVGLAAQEDSTVRVTVDGVVEFDGVLREGQRQLWEGRQRIQVRTENGQTLLLSVNGEDLGPYSPAMGHPDWNRIDFGFWPGWEQDEVYGRGRRE